MPRRSHRLLFLALAAAACIELDPQPLPAKGISSNDPADKTVDGGDSSGAFESQLVFVSAPVDGTDDVAICGDAGAIAARGTVLVTNVRTNASFDFTSDDTGAFVGVVKAAIGDTLAVKIIAAGGAVTDVGRWVVPASSHDAIAAPDLNGGSSDAGMPADAGSATDGGTTPARPEGLFTVAAPDSSGLITVRGSGWHQGYTAVAFDLTSGSTRHAAVESSGDVALLLRAHTGDMVYAFVSDNAGANVAGSTFVLKVP